jgi:hypothetical protein
MSGYYYMDGNERRGPFSLVELRSQHISPETVWKRAGQIGELRSLFANKVNVPSAGLTDGLPTDLTYQLLAGETVHYFSYIAFKGGCGSSDPKEHYWLALTNRRVLYKTKVAESDGKRETYVEKDGILPFDKISFIEVSEASESSGCSKTTAFRLRISTSGGTVIIPIPTRERGYEVRRMHSELSQQA